MNLYCHICNKDITSRVKKGIYTCVCSKNYNQKNKIFIQKKIYKNIKDFFKPVKNNKFEYGKTVIPLSVPTFGYEEAFESTQSLLNTYVTLGSKVKKFEKLFSNYAKVNYSTLVTSGSTANSLALAALTSETLKKRILPGDEVITPAVTYATTVFPILDINAVPVLVDIDLKTLNIDVELIESVITNKTKAIMPVHLLGNPCNMEAVNKIAKKYDLYVIEDTADSSGAEINNKKCGSFGDIGTFSFFFTHIMTTIEGGMLCCNNQKISEIIKSKRQFGWIRDLSDKDYYANKYSNIDPRFLFITRGYNYKPTEIQGAFGIHQLKKVDKFVENRRSNANYWSKKFQKYKDVIITIEEQPNTKSAWYGFPIIVKNEAPFSKNDLIKFLNKKGVQTRPILSGNMAQQPVSKTFKYKQTTLRNSIFVNDNSFWLGNHQEINKIEREAVASYVDEFMNKYY